MLRRFTEISIYLLVGGALSATGAGQLAAAEVFFCTDGRVLKVDATNRDKLADDPCVKEWFEKTAPRPVAAKDPLRAGGEKETVHVRRYNRASRTIVDPAN